MPLYGHAEKPMRARATYAGSAGYGASTAMRTRRSLNFRARQAILDAVTPDDIARLALFLASESQRITRQCFQVDGGLG
jgi:NAD(P)-dependent dehydrogenase (short-subunit alcohol dehydrogenase family)